VQKTDLAVAIYRASHLKGEFQLRSGATATEYFDKYQFESDPNLLQSICEQLTELIPAGVDVLAGLELGGVPIAAVLSQVTGLPTLYVRKKPKQYGTCRLAEGGELSGRNLLLVEDVVTSGGQILESTAELRSRGAVVKHALCVIDREAGGAAALADDGVSLHPLFTMSQLKAV
jgi:orotate phosphoribosyltransferase